MNEPSMQEWEAMQAMALRRRNALLIPIIRVFQKRDLPEPHVYVDRSSVGTVGFDIHVNLGREWVAVLTPAQLEKLPDDELIEEVNRSIDEYLASRPLTHN